MTEYARRSARVLLLNDQDRVLLFSYNSEADNPAAGHIWFTPGGGVDAGEDLREAAVRELSEETGLRVPVDELGPLVAFTSGEAHLGWANGRFRDDLFLHRVKSHDVAVDGMLGYEVRNLRGHRWWSVAELRETDETVVPWELAGLLERLVRGDIPAEPVELPWHH